MSDTATAAPEVAPAVPVAPEAPVTPTETPATPAPAPVKAEPVKAEPAKTETAAEMIRSTKRRDPVDTTHHSQTQPRTEEGKFDGPPDATAKPAADTPQPGSDGPAQAAKPPEATVRIELPEGHPLRDQGVQHIDAPAGQERHYRALVNGSVRRSEVEASQQRERQLQTQLIDLQAQVRALSEGMDGPTPEVLEVQADIQKLREAGFDKQADLMLEGLKARQRAKADGYKSELSAEQQQVQAREAGMRFISDAQSAAKVVFGQSGWDPPVEAALEVYAKIKPENEPPTIEAFMEVLKREYFNAVGTGKVKPAVQVPAPAPVANTEVTTLTQQVEELKQQLATLTRRATNPMGALPAGTSNNTGGTAPETARDVVRQAQRRELRA